MSNLNEEDFREIRQTYAQGNEHERSQQILSFLTTNRNPDAFRWVYSFRGQVGSFAFVQVCITKTKSRNFASNRLLSSLAAQRENFLLCFAFTKLVQILLAIEEVAEFSVPLNSVLQLVGYIVSLL